jgi:hypothetical protein
VATLGKILILGIVALTTATRGEASRVPVRRAFAAELREIAVTYWPNAPNESAAWRIKLKSGVTSLDKPSKPGSKESIRPYKWEFFTTVIRVINDETFIKV